MKKIFIAFICLYLNISCAGNNNAPAEDLTTINTPEELNNACKKKSIKYFKEKNKTPNDWTSVWRVEKNIIDVKGEWKVDATKYVVICRIKQGLKEKVMVISIEEKKAFK